MCRFAKWKSVVAVLTIAVIQPRSIADEVWQSLGSGMDSYVRALAIYNGELIAGGDFFTAGGQGASRVARWDGGAWQSLGSGMNNSVQALAVYNNELIAGGFFTTAGGVTVNRIARWNGQSWQPLGAGMNDAVYALTVYNGELIAGGDFTTADGQTVNRIARWNGTAWLPMTSAGQIGVNSSVKALTVWNSELIAGGNFSTAGAQTVNLIARWNGAAWNPITFGGQNGANGVGVFALTVWNGDLIVGGYFSSVGGQLANHIARWDGSTWDRFIDGPNIGVSDWVNALTVYAGELIVGGNFASAGGNTVNRIARWSGSAWQSPLGTGMGGEVTTLTIYNSNLMVGGLFTTAGGTVVNYIASSNANSIITGQCPVWSDMGGGLSNVASTMTLFNGDLIVGGAFFTAGGQSMNSIARWDGTNWNPLVSGGHIGVGDGIMTLNVAASAVWNESLVVGGGFLSAGGQTVNRIARWNGSAWFPMTSGGQIGVNGGFEGVIALTIWNNDLIAAGDFATAGGQTVNRIARWNGTSWSPLVSGGQTGVNGTVRALTVWNGDLVVGGDFTTAGGQTFNHIARWNGTSWQQFTSGGQNGLNGGVSALIVWNANLVAGGFFTTAGSQTVNSIARWNGSAWLALTSGGQIGVGGNVSAFAVFNADLIVGGNFATAGGLIVDNIARWNGSQWQSMNGGVAGSINTLAVHNTSLIAGGLFSGPAAYIAQWNQPSVWLTPQNGTFTNNLNWEAGFFANSPTLFGKTGGTNQFTVTFGAPAQSESLCITNQKPIFNLNGHEYDIADYTTIGAAQPAQLTVNNGTLISPTVAVGSAGTLGGDGQISGNVFNVGTVSPGSSATTPGTLTITGAYQQPFGLFNPHIDLSSGQYSRLDVALNASIAGTLRVDRVGSPQFTPDQQFSILTCGTLSGSFDVALLPFIGNDLVMNVQYGGGALAESSTDGTSGGSGVSIVIGAPNGSPDFDNPETFSLEGTPTGVSGATIGGLPAAQDLVLSIAAALPTDPGNALILLNQGDGSGFDPVIIPVGHEPSGIVAASLADGGGDDDFAVPNRGDNNVMVFFHESGSSFSMPLTVPVSNAPSAIAAGNLRGAAAGNLIDLIVANENSNTITILQNNGNRTFTALAPINVGGQPRSIAAADLAGDSLPDLAVVNFGSDSVTILPNSGGVFASSSSPIPVGNEPVHVSPADLDNDRDLDLVVSCLSGALTLVINQGGGTFTASAQLPMDGQVSSSAAWDMDLDGDVDLVAIVDDQSLGEPVIRLLRNDSTAGQIAFTVFDPIAQGDNPKLVNGTDVTGDNQQDLVAVNVTDSALTGGSSLAGLPAKSSLSIRPTLLKKAKVPGDITNDGQVNVNDLLAVINQWGPCPAPPQACTGDIAPAPTGNGIVNVNDLLMVINNWG